MHHKVYYSSTDSLDEVYTKWWFVGGVATAMKRDEYRDVVESKWHLLLKTVRGAEETLVVHLSIARPIPIGSKVTVERDAPEDRDYLVISRSRLRGEIPKVWLFDTTM